MTRKALLAGLLSLAACTGTDQPPPVMPEPIPEVSWALPDPYTPGGKDYYDTLLNGAAPTAAGEAAVASYGAGQGYDNGYVDYAARNRANRGDDNPYNSTCPLCALKQFSAGQQLNREFNTNVWPTDWFSQ